MTSSSNQSDLDLEVFRFVMGEMSESERNQFELLLSQDAALCEAVADMQLLCSSAKVALAPSAKPAVNREPASALRWWVSLMLTLAVIAGVSLWVPQQGFVPVEKLQVVEADSGTSPLVLAAWTDLQPASQETSPDQLFEPDADLVETVSYEVPNWMLIAVDPQMEDRVDEVTPRQGGTL